VNFGPLDRDLEQRHRAVTQVDAAFLAATRPGNTVGAAFRSGLDAYATTGFPDEWRLHHQGGPTGYAGRDYRANAEGEAVIQENQAFAWNPSIAGTKSEDTILATATGPEVLSLTPDLPSLYVETGDFRIERSAILIR
jgi:Xaa-Pro aminopeptidase